MAHWIRHLPDVRGSRILSLSDLIDQHPNHAALEDATLAYAELHWSKDEIAEAKELMRSGAAVNVVEQMAD